MSLPFFLCLMAMCCGYALWRGGAPERWAAALQITAFALGVPVHFALDAVGYRSAIVAHFAKVLDPDMLAAGYAIQAQIWAYPMLLLTAIGAVRHRRRVCAGLSDPSWKAAPG